MKKAIYNPVQDCKWPVIISVTYEIGSSKRTERFRLENDHAPVVEALFAASSGDTSYSEALYEYGAAEGAKQLHLLQAKVAAKKAAKTDLTPEGAALLKKSYQEPLPLVDDKSNKKKKNKTPDPDPSRRGIPGVDYRWIPCVFKRGDGNEYSGVVCAKYPDCEICEEACSGKEYFGREAEGKRVVLLEDPK
jgi:hypothetical protein